MIANKKACSPKSRTQKNSAPKNYVVGLVLAAGQGTRFGGHKLRHLINGDTPMGVQCALNLKPHVDEVVCVVRPDDQELKILFAAQGFTLVDNPDFELGLSSSIRAGVAAHPNADYWLIALGDMPFIQTTTYDMVSNAIKNECKTCPSQHRIIRPCIVSKSANTRHAGHPVAFPNRLKSELLALTGDKGAAPIFKQQAKTKQKKANETIHWLLVNDDGIRLDIDQLSDIPTIREYS